MVFGGRLGLYFMILYDTILYVYFKALVPIWITSLNQSDKVYLMTLCDNLACTPDFGQVVLTVPSPLKREDSLSLGVGGRSTFVTAGSWSRHSQPHRGGSTVSGCSSR